MIVNKQYIMSIQSLVSTGFVGNNMATFAIQSFGIDVIMLPTVLFSTHADQNEYYGEAISPNLFAALLQGIKVSEAYQHTHIAQSGYINSMELIDLASGFLSEWKEEHNQATYIYDPVFGDTRTNGLYIDENVVEHSVSKLLPLADIFTPNHFELEYVLGAKIDSETKLKHLLVENVQWAKCKTILTSAELSDVNTKEVETILIDKGQLTRFVSEKIPIEVVGTGDLFNACLSAFLAQGYKVEQAIPETMHLVTEVLRYLYENDLTEINAAALCKVLKVRKAEIG